MKKNARFLLLVAPGCLSSLVALVCAIAAVFALVAMMRQKNSSASISSSDLRSLTLDQTFEGTFEQPVDYSDPLLAERKIVLATNLNPHASRDVVSKLLFLNRAASSKPIDLYLRTNGGKYNDAFAIIDTMHLIKAPVNVWAVGGCFSAGAVILTSATGKRCASHDTEIMVHANLEYGGKPDDFENALVDKDRVEAIYKSRAHLPKEWFPLSGNKGYYFNAETAKKYGIVDEIR